MKIYYMVDMETAGYPIYYISAKGEVVKDDVEYLSPSDACEEFLHQHPGAQYQNCKEWAKRITQLAKEKALLATWK